MVIFKFLGEETRGGGEGVVGGGGRPAGGMNTQMMAMHSLSTQMCCEVHEIKLSQTVD
jgi:hypothetical protein